MPTTLKEVLSCPVCYRLLRDTRVLKCGHTICRLCKETLMSGNRVSAPCPLCRARFSQRDGDVRNVVLESIATTFCCPHDGCDEVHGREGEASRHREECPRREVVCTDCGRTVPNSDDGVAHHESRHRSEATFHALRALLMTWNPGDPDAMGATDQEASLIFDMNAETARMAADVLGIDVSGTPLRRQLALPPAAADVVEHRDARTGEAFLVTSRRRNNPLERADRIDRAPTELVLEEAALADSQQRREAAVVVVHPAIDLSVAVRETGGGHDDALQERDGDHDDALQERDIRRRMRELDIHVPPDDRRRQEIRDLIAESATARLEAPNVPPPPPSARSDDSPPPPPPRRGEEDGRMPNPFV